MRRVPGLNRNATFSALLGAKDNSLRPVMVLRPCARPAPAATIVRSTMSVAATTSGLQEQRRASPRHNVGWQRLTRPRRPPPPGVHGDADEPGDPQQRGFLCSTLTSPST